MFTFMEIPREDSVAILNPINYNKLGAGLTTVLNQPYTSPILRDLNLPNVAGFSCMESNYVGTHTVGSARLDTLTVKTTVVSGANQIVLTGATASRVLKEGDRFTVADVKYVTPAGKQATNKLVTFVVQADATESGGDITVTVQPEMNLTGPRQNVDRLPTAADAVTVIADASGKVTYNYAVNPNSFSVVGLRMPGIDGAENGSAQDNDSQMSVRVVKQGNIQSSTNRFRVDILPAIAAFADYGVTILS